MPRHIQGQYAWPPFSLRISFTSIIFPFQRSTQLTGARLVQKKKVVPMLVQVGDTLTEKLALYYYFEFEGDDDTVVFEK